jgi:hypothetical protein
VLQTFAEVADVTPPTVHTPPSDSRIGPPESPEQTELTLALNWVSSSVPAALIVVTPARNVEGISSWLRPQPAITADSPTRASRLRRTGTGVRPIGCAMNTTATSEVVPPR